ncbi:MAG: DUF4190 domain-containing protein [Acidobacteria bacterium]|nr:MAG: DUF4190 domain-containing protein [Acidobacteriota bacterium]REK01323.1 MAG: DUF4190 domain-containing protein [Acidobacteriota bacterium]REK14279.1 MAG: DUF4190 domain-containing protein [Acidobacteriota bacterium]REK44994.1 MAG: DUF4190 domain-containing protein [Acidobacteriota bacterium]
MKHCPRCNQRYEDENLNFCLNDGELLVEFETSDAPPTLYMDSPRKTKENWPEVDSGQQADNQQIYATRQPQQMYQPPGGPAAQYAAGTDNSLPTISLVLGITSWVLICCYLGIPLGAAAVITGYIGYSRTGQNPEAYGGGSMAIVGMVLGGVSFFLTILLFIFGAIGGMIG